MVKTALEKKIDILIEYKTIYMCDNRLPNRIYRGISIDKVRNMINNIIENGVMTSEGIVYGNNKLLPLEYIEKLKNNNLWNKTDIKDDWYINYYLLRQYIHEYKKLPLPDEVYKNKLLGRWLEYQMNICLYGKEREDGSFVRNKVVIEKEKIMLLNKLGIHFNRIDPWKSNFNELKEYIDSNNGKYPKEDNVKLKRYVSKIRNIYNNGVKKKNGDYIYNGSVLSSENIELLNSISFKFNYRDEIFGTEIMNKDDLKFVRTYLEKELSKIIKDNKDLQFDNKRVYNKFKNSCIKKLNLKIK